MKICNRCKTELSENMFTKNKNYLDGLSYYCKQCTKKIKKNYYQIHKQKCKDQDKKWRTSLTEQFKYTWSSYSAMKRRCYGKNHIAYPLYGGRGIRVCERWKESFKNFVSDMGLKPFKGWCIDRINNNDNYEPSNCRWLSLQDSLKNK